MTVEDPRLERLYDYTKFHIGVYILALGAMVTVAASVQLASFVSGALRNREAFTLAILAMAVAGGAGGIIAATCATAAKFEDVWTTRIGPWDLPLLKGRHWAGVEHGAFWVSAALLVYAAVWR